MRMENPLVGSFNRERTILVFRQRSLEFYASLIGIAGGGSMVALAILQQFFGLFWGLMFPTWNFFFGALFLIASLAAYFGFRSVKFDVRKKLFQIRTRIGLLPSTSTGSFDEIGHLELAPYDGLFPTSLTQSSIPGMIAAPVAYGQLFVIRLHWRDPRKAPIVLEHVQTLQAYGQFDRSLMNFTQKAQQYSNALGVTLLSNVPLPGMTRIS